MPGKRRREQQSAPQQTGLLQGANRRKLLKPNIIE